MLILFVVGLVCNINLVLPTLIVAPIDTIGLLNEDIRLSCRTDVPDVPTNWEVIRIGSSEATDIYSAGVLSYKLPTRYSIEKTVKGQHDLLIRSIVPSDAGKYRCTDEAGFGVMIEVTLTVSDGCIEKIPNLSPWIAVVGQTVTLKCMTGHGNHPRWIIDSANNESSSIPKTLKTLQTTGVQQNFDLILHSVRPSDAGEYFCVEGFGAESFTLLNSTVLTVLSTDSVCYSSPNVTAVGTNEIVTMSCFLEFHGKSSPKLQWMVHGKPITPKMDTYTITEELNYPNKTSSTLTWTRLPEDIRGILLYNNFTCHVVFPPIDTINSSVATPFECSEAQMQRPSYRILAIALGVTLPLFIITILLIVFVIIPKIKEQHSEVKSDIKEVQPLIEQHQVPIKRNYHDARDGEIITNDNNNWLQQNYQRLVEEMVLVDALVLIQKLAETNRHVRETIVSDSQKNKSRREQVEYILKMLSNGPDSAVNDLIEAFEETNPRHIIFAADSK